MSDKQFTDKILWSHIINAEGIGVFWKDKERRFVGVNKKFLDSYGLKDASEVIGKTDEEMYWNIDDEEFKKEEEEILRAGKKSIGLRGRTIIRGMVHEIIANKEPIYENGEIVGLLGQFIDLGELSSYISRDDMDAAYSDETMLTAVKILETIQDLSERYQKNQEDFCIVRFTWKEYGRVLAEYGEDLVYHIVKRMGQEIAEKAKHIALYSYIGNGVFVMVSRNVDKAFHEKNQWDVLERMRRLKSIRENGLSGAFQVKTMYASECKDLSQLVSFTMAPKDILAKATYLDMLDGNHILEQVPAAIIIIAVTPQNESSILYMSNPVKAVLGNAVGRCKDVESMLSFVTEEDRERITLAAKESLETRSPFNEIFQIQSEDGRMIHAYFLTKPMEQEDGGCLFFGVYTDVTEKTSLEEERQKLVQERLQRYENLVSNIEPEDERNLVLRVSMEENDILSWWSAEDGYDIDESWNLFAFRDFILAHAFSEEDRNILWKNIDFDTIVRGLNLQGYATAQAEYMRLNRKGEAIWSRFEIRSVVEPATQHIHNYMYIFNVNEEYMPPVFAHQLAQQESEMVILLNLENQLVQIYDLRDGRPMASLAIDDFRFVVEDYARAHIADQENLETFILSLSYETVISEMKKNDGIYFVGQWVIDKGERRRKAWRYTYANEERTAILVSRSDITDSYLNEEEYREQINEIKGELETMNKDVTGALTRRRAFHEIRKMFLDKKGNYVVIMVDMDNLKYTNDHFGHPSGDFAISTIAEILLRNFRSTDVVGRIGGDEFMVFCPGMGLDNAMQKVETILGEVRSVLIHEEEQYYLSCSIGYFAGKFEDFDFDECYKKVDLALYEAKKEKNRAVLYQEAFG